jgi:hypothetical protein
VAAPVFAASAQVRGEELDVTVLGGDAGVVEDARDRLIELLARFDAADPDSELARVNASAGAPVPYSWETLLLISLLDEAVDGHVDLDTAGSTATVAAGRRLDPGRLGAGVALDMVVQDLEADGVTGAGIRLGRDLRAVGTSPYAGGWTVEHCGTRWRLPSGAAMTAGGTPGGVDTVTVMADTAWQAASLAHRAARGGDDAYRLLADSGLPALLTRSGHTVALGLPASSQVDLT